MANSHGSLADFIGNGYALSPFLNQAHFSGSRDTAETTTFGKNSKTYIPGLRDTQMVADGLYDGATAAVDEAFMAALGASGNGIFSYMPAGDAQIGNIAFTLDAIESAYEVSSAVGDVSQVHADFNAGDTGNFTRGLIGHPFIVEAAPGNSASQDFGSVNSTNGGYLVAHATAAASLVVFLQDSADNITFADLAGSLNFASARGSQRLALPSTIRRYTRVRWTGSGTFLAIFERL